MHCAPCDAPRSAAQVVRASDTPHRFGGRDFLEFENITVVPIQTKLVDAALLSDAELRWLNDYNAACREALAPHLRDAEDAAWLHRETAPLERP